jgi:hypothetical protein
MILLNKNEEDFFEKQKQADKKFIFLLNHQFANGKK